MMDDKSDHTNLSSEFTFDTFPSWIGKAILLIDLDAFFASVEQLDHPAWRGKPVIVGGDAEKRGVVSTASYEARKFGVHSAMPSVTAHHLCPDAIWTQGHYDRYRTMSNQVMNILLDESPFIQQVSIDEAFLDITPTPHNAEHPIVIARRIQYRISELGITCSIGLGTSKTVAKIASDRDKPQGLTVIYPNRETSFLNPLPIRALSGIGKASEEILKKHDILTLGDLARTNTKTLEKLLGKNGKVMHLRANGKDDSPIETQDTQKSISNEITFAEDLVEQREIEAAISTLASKVGRRLRKKNLKGQTISLRVRFDDRSIRNVQKKLDKSTNDDLLFAPLLFAMLHEVWGPGMPVRLLGVGVSGFNQKETDQLTLFIQERNTENKSVLDPIVKDEEKRTRLIAMTDKVKDRFGEDAVLFGHEIHTGKKTTGSGSKNPADYK